MTIVKEGVTVVATNVVTQIEYTGISDITGNVVFAELPEGEYTVGVNMPNGYSFKVDDADNAIIDANNINDDMSANPFVGVDIVHNGNHTMTIVLRHIIVVSILIQVLGSAGNYTVYYGASIVEAQDVAIPAFRIDVVCATIPALNDDVYFSFDVNVTQSASSQQGLGAVDPQGIGFTLSTTYVGDMVITYETVVITSTPGTFVYPNVIL